MYKWAYVEKKKDKNFQIFSPSLTIINFGCYDIFINI